MQAHGARRSADGSAHHRSTVDSADLQQAPDLKPLRINKNNFAGLEAQGRPVFSLCLCTCCCPCWTQLASFETMRASAAVYDYD